MADINVSVTIDTVNITSSNLSTTVVLTDDNGDHDDTPGDSTTFDIEAGTNQTVKFNIYAKDSSTEVNFVSFADENDVQCFVELPSSSNDWTGTTAAAEVAVTENFSITFDVAGKGQFTLDPELKVKQ